MSSNQSSNATAFSQQVDHFLTRNNQQAERSASSADALAPPAAQSENE